MRLILINQFQRMFFCSWIPLPNLKNRPSLSTCSYQPFSAFSYFGLSHLPLNWLITVMPSVNYRCIEAHACKDHYNRARNHNYRFLLGLKMLQFWIGIVFHTRNETKAIKLMSSKRDINIYKKLHRKYLQ